MKGVEVEKDKRTMVREKDNVASIQKRGRVSLCFRLTAHGCLGLGFGVSLKGLRVVVEVSLLSSLFQMLPRLDLTPEADRFKNMRMMLSKVKIMVVAAKKARQLFGTRPFVRAIRSSLNGGW